MYKILDVCGYIINYSNRMDYGVSNLKLQKLLYFIQAAFLSIADDSEACFSARIEAWDFGPVVPIAYYEFKHFGSSDIPDISKHLIYQKDKPWKGENYVFNENVINSKDKKEIEEVIDLFSEYSASDLVAITHNQAPWKDAYSRGRNTEITTEAIREYFRSE